MQLATSKVIKKPFTNYNSLLSDESIIEKDLIVDSRSKPKAGSIMVGYLGNKKKRIDIPQEKVLEHVVIIGANGSGQVINFFYPNLIDLENSFVIVHQCSHDYEILKSFHKKVLLYDPDNQLTEQFNWIPLCKENIRWAYLLAEASLAKRAEEASSFRTQEAVRLLAAIYAHTASLANPVPLESHRLIFNNSVTQLLSILSISTSNVAKRIAISLEAVSIKVLEGYLVDIRTSLGWLANPNITFFTDTTIAPDFSCLRKEKMGVYIKSPDWFYQIQALRQIIITVIVNQLKENDGSPIYLFISHLAAIGYLSCLENLTSLTQHNIALIISLHSSTIIWEISYGEENAKRMLDSCYCKIVLDQCTLFRSRESINKTNKANEVTSTTVHDKKLCLEILTVFVREHLLFLDNKPPIIVGTLPGSKILDQKLNKSDFKLTYKLLVYLVVTSLLITYISYRVLFV